MYCPSWRIAGCVRAWCSKRGALPLFLTITKKYLPMQMFLVWMELEVTKNWMHVYSRSVRMYVYIDRTGSTNWEGDWVRLTQKGKAHNLPGSVITTRLNVGKYRNTRILFYLHYSFFLLIHRNLYGYDFLYWYVLYFIHCKQKNESLVQLIIRESLYYATNPANIVCVDNASVPALKAML